MWDSRLSIVKGEHHPIHDVAHRVFDLFAFCSIATCIVFFAHFYKGYPEHMTFGEFRRRFDILAPVQTRSSGPVLDEKKV